MCNFIVHQITRVRQSSLKLEAKRKQMKRDMRVCVCVFWGGGVDLLLVQSDWKSF